MSIKRITTIPAFNLKSSYEKKKEKGKYWNIDVFKEGRFIVPQMFNALKKLDELITLNGGNLHIIDLYRSWETQSKARESFLNGTKKAYVAKYSFHTAGRAVDISLPLLNFQDIKKENWLEMLWDIALPLGFKPIINIPDMNASEAWHFDWPGEWTDAYDKLPYTEVAKCCILDSGCWNKEEDLDKLEKLNIQAQLLRLGNYEIGKLDGIIGKKTITALKKYHIDDLSQKEVLNFLFNI